METAYQLSQMQFNISIEEYRNEKESHLPFQKRKGRQVPTMFDDGIKDEPIYILNLGRKYRFRIVTHRTYERYPFDDVASICLRLPDVEAIYLKTEHGEDSYRGLNWVAELEGDGYQSRKLSTISPPFGELEKKYVFVDVSIQVKVKKTLHWLLQRETIILKMVRSGRRLIRRRILCKTRKTWNSLPQSVRSVARDTYFCVKAISSLY